MVDRAASARPSIKRTTAVSLPGTTRLATPRAADRPGQTGSNHAGKLRGLVMLQGRHDFIDFHVHKVSYSVLSMYSMISMLLIALLIYVNVGSVWVHCSLKRKQNQKESACISCSQAQRNTSTSYSDFKRHHCHCCIYLSWFADVCSFQS